MKIRFKAFTAGIVLGIFLAPAFQATAQEPAFVSHKAVYQIRLGELRDNAIAAISGNVAYGVEKSCDGWVMAQTGTTYIHLPTGDAIPQALRYSAWESNDGAAYRFTMTTEDGAQEVILGHAELTPGRGGSAAFQRPEEAAFELPSDTLFPMAHTRFMIDSARAGKTQAQSHIFEGTDVGGAKLLVMFISPFSDEARAVVDNIGGKILDRPGWNFRLAYFDPTDQSGQPLYEIEADVLDNGVAPRWVLDYGAYSVVMTLAKVEGQDAPDC